jgi:YidC/Oxa1 family membrane protein insertase
LEQQRNLILFITLSMFILGLWMYLMPQPPAPPAGIPSSAVSQPATTASASSAKTSSEVVKRTVSAHVVSNVSRSLVTIETDDYIATFSNEGAVLTGFQLKKYMNRQTQKPIELVNAAADRSKPFSLVYDPLPELNQKMFTIEGVSKKLSGSDDKAKLVFRYADASGTVLEKTFRFQNKSYLIPFEVIISQAKGSVPASHLAVEWADTLGMQENTGTQSRMPGCRVATLSAGHVSFESSKKSKESLEIPAPITWTAVTDQFFVAALVPDATSGGASVKVLRDYNVFKTPTPDNPDPGIDPAIFGPRPLLVFEAPALKGGESFERKGQAFVGPQDYELLKGLKLQLENVVDFGWFGFISVYMLALLKWFYTVAHNWGLAIILLSLLVKLVLWLPTHNSYKNMSQMQRKMKEIQPKLDAIKRKYPDDKQKQQQETMAIYQTAGINPMGGCLPLLLQMPVFFALYATLGHSIELRGASFLWLHDLSLKDPFYVFPLLMGASMVLQQKVSGQMATQAAGQQKLMMWMMPVLLTFFAFQWPAGLLVYWVVTNLLSMVQQKIVNREIQNARKKEEVAKS